MASLTKLFFRITSKHQKIAHKNIALVFPEKSEEQRNKIYNDSIIELSRLLSDMIRLPKMDKEWIKSHVQFENIEELITLHANKKTGVILSSAHLGSFEVLARSLAGYDFSTSFIARNFAFPSVDAWWKGHRNIYGNEMINREGAYKKVIRNLKARKDVGILFDQNITRNHAVFVDFFGIPAATTKTLALAALQTKAPFILITIKHTGNDQYVVKWQELKFQEIYDNTTMTKDQKVLEITKQASKALEARIKDFPEGWFWAHRRWKTRPLETDESPYS